MHVIYVPGKKENEAEKKYEERITKKFSKLIKVSNHRIKKPAEHQVG